MATHPTPPALSIEALRAGNRIEFARMVETYSMPIYRLALRMLGNQQDAEDVLQNTFVNALTHLAGFEGRSSLLTWLYRIAVNEALMLLRRNKPEMNLDDSEAENEEEDLTPIQFVDWGGLPEELLLSGEARQALEAAIRQMPESLRTVFALRDLQELSIRETAGVLGLSEANIKIRLLRARLFLRERLSTYYGERIIQEKPND